MFLSEDLKITFWTTHIILPFFADSFEDHDVEWGEDDDWPQLGGDQGVDAVEQGVVPEQKKLYWRASRGKGENVTK